MHRQAEDGTATDVAGAHRHAAVHPADMLLSGTGDSQELLNRVWQDAASLGRHPRYRELLGQPTLRERLVALAARLGNLSDGTRLPRGVPQFAMACMMAIAVFGGAWMLRPATPDFETRVAEIRDIPLKDGSLVTLGGHSALDVDFSHGERTVQLTRGEAFFSVSPDKNRPFVVLVGGQRIRVVGTKFNVNFDGDHVAVSVKEGVVQVAPDPVGSKPSAGSVVTLVAGQKLRAGGTARSLPEQLGGSEPGAWRSGHLDYHDTSLGEIIADARRYYPHPITITSASLAGERLTTSFSTSQVDQMLDTLPGILPVSVERMPDGSVTLRQKSALPN
ncbi:FecR domain-containing protein [Erythrobacter sp. SG61-1L]|uniref:FecR family protein n=1 Tax=Erythrobacter sp. SG61-1L TaxID=1603897 RepID=UPI0006C92C00|nr:FecR domain-containing protein [Erythrobacter sp. SG61-1L]